MTIGPDSFMPHSQSTTILIIDDSSTQAMNLMFKLKKLGFEVVVCQNGIDGINMASKLLPDLIICDVLMDELSGHQVCRLLKSQENTKRIPILIYSGLEHKIDQFWAIKAGAEDFCSKSVEFQELAHKINALILQFPRSSFLYDRDKAADRIITSQNLKSKVNYLLDSSLIRSTITNEFRNLYKFIQDEQGLTDKILTLMFDIVDFNVCGIFYNDEFKTTDLVLYMSIYNLSEDSVLYKTITTDLFHHIFEKEAGTNDDFYHYEILQTREIKQLKLKKTPKFLSQIILPMYSEQGELLGVVSFYNTQDQAYDNLKPIFKLITDELSILLQLKMLYSKAKTLSITDGLTKLYNRRFFQDTIEREFSRAKRYSLELCLVMIDIDHFKKINDNYGHQFGDTVLVRVAEMTKKGFRKSDVVSKYGGEEIVAILPETSIDNAFIPCERIRKLIEEEIFQSHEQNVTTSVSIGIASLTNWTSSCEQIIKNADEALYEAKRLGRNQIIKYSDIEGNA